MEWTDFRGLQADGRKSTVSIDHDPVEAAVFEFNVPEENADVVDLRSPKASDVLQTAGWLGSR